TPVLFPRGFRHHLVLLQEGVYMRPMQVGLLGLGTVGGGTFEVLRRNQEEIRRRAGRDITICKAAVRDLQKARQVVAGSDVVLTQDPFEVVRDPDVEIVAELMGGTGLARELVLAA